MRLFLFLILIPFLTFGQVYYSQNNSIYETDLDGSYFDLIYTGNNSIKNIEIDNLKNEIYWIENNSILKSSLLIFSPVELYISDSEIDNLYFSNLHNCIYFIKNSNITSNPSLNKFENGNVPKFIQSFIKVRISNSNCI